MLGQRGGRQRGNKTARRPEGSLAADPRLDDSVTPGPACPRARVRDRSRPIRSTGACLWSSQCLIEISDNGVACFGPSFASTSATAATIPTLEGTPRTEAERCLASPPVSELKCAERQGAFSSNATV